MTFPASTEPSSNGQSASASMSGAQIARLVGNYKLTPATLMSEVADWWYPAPFLQYLAAEIASAVARGNCGLLISAPPRHGKSKLITVATPLWVLENFPKKNVIVATYGEDLSTDFTREVKDLIKANRSKLSVSIRRDVDRAQNFVTTQGGGLKAVGLRGTITGRGADVLIIDDYIKEPKEALNANYLESLRTWYATVARTRLEPNAVVIIVATRWVTNDLHGYIERMEARRSRKFYNIIKIPAIAGKKDSESGEWGPGMVPDILGRAPGEPLFERRYNREQLEDLRVELGNRWFEAMFQQNPVSEDSAITNVENLRYITKEDFAELLASDRKPGRFKRRRAWDFASTKDAGDFTAGPEGVYDTATKKLYLTSLVHGQYSAGRTEQIYVAHAEHDHPDVEYVIEQEPGSAGAYASGHFKQLAPQRVVRVVKSAAEGSKLLKAQPFLAATEAHNVVLVIDDLKDIQATPWATKFIDEFADFPEGTHDDIMDAVSSLYNDCTGRKPLAGAFGRSKAAEEAAKGQKLGDGTVKYGARGSVTFGRSNPNTVRPPGSKKSVFSVG